MFVEEFSRRLVEDDVRGPAARGRIERPAITLLVEGAKAQGKRISRPPIPSSKQREIVRLHKGSRSLRQIEAEIGVSRATAAKNVNLNKRSVADS
ncbi:MAG: hypothetical protein GKS06_15840 [Acidobacteria bacterium]|nr:hypothetical protein [Acidobacteriota bacterium]